jgi:hypothetical protein
MLRPALKREPHSYLTGAELLSAPMVRLVQLATPGGKGPCQRLAA